MDRLCFWSGMEIARAIKAGELSPVEVIECFLKRIEEVNPLINAIVTLTGEQALAEARKAEARAVKGEELGPLHGVPVTIKDNVFTKGIKTTFGSRLYEDFVPEVDAILVERLKAAGAIVIGKTNLPEFGLIPITDNLVFGPTRNPWNLQKTSGGSSGGAAAGVAAGLSPLSTGNDGGGSIRIPSSLCGVFGFKPSFGRIPCYPRLNGWETMNHEGPITRTVADAALMMEIMAGPDERDRFTLPPAPADYLSSLPAGVSGLKIAYSPDLGYAAVDPEVREITRRAALVFQELGCSVDEIDPGLPNMEPDLGMMVVTETITTLEEQIDRWKEVGYPLNLAFLSIVDSISNRDIARVQFRREELWQKVRSIFDNYDLLLTPSTAVTAFDSGSGGPMGPPTIDGKEVGPVSWIAFTFPFNFTGQPASSVPCGFNGEGLPVGLQIVGRRYDERTVFRASAAFEESRPWRNLFPEYKGFAE